MEKKRRGVEKAVEWIRSQQNSDGSVLSYPGGFKYNEIAAYFVKLALLFDNLDAATRAANWLLSQLDGGWISWNTCDDCAYYFDSMIIADALTDMYNETLQQKYADGAAMISWFYESMIDAVGQVPTMCQKNLMCYNGAKYYQRPGCLYLKTLPTAKYLGANKLAVWLKRFEDLMSSTGGFHVHDKSIYTFVHFHCYALDGTRLHRKGAKWLVARQREDGSLPAWSNNLGWVMPGAVAQAAYHMALEGYMDESEAAMGYVWDSQLENGAIPISVGSINSGGETWPTLFAAWYQAQIELME